MTITGATRIYAIMGDPIAQVRSPEVFTQRFAAAGANAVLIPAHVPVERFARVVPMLLEIANLDGLLVTVPFKARMTEFASRLGPTASCIGAVNALRREADGSWTGDMFDGIGFVRGAEHKGARVRARRVALFGAGGAGSAIACALADAGVQSIEIIDPEPGKAQALVEKLEPTFDSCDFRVGSRVPADADMIVNASPVGMRPEDPLPGAVGRLDPGVLVGDVVIAPEPTPLIRHAMQCGCAWVEGRDMHSGQVDALLAFFGMTADREAAGGARA